MKIISIIIGLFLSAICGSLGFCFLLIFFNENSYPYWFIPLMSIACFYCSWVTWEKYYDKAFGIE